MSMNKRAQKSLVLALGLVVGGLYASTNNIYAAEKEIVTAQSLNVRKGPSVENDRVGSLDRGMVVEILESNNGWNKVKLSNGEEGWVNGDYTAKEKGTVTATKLNVRKGPSVENDKIGLLDNNTVVEILEDQDNWYKIKLDDNQEGWISGDYVLTESQANEQAKKQQVSKKSQNNKEVKEVKAEAVNENTANNTVEQKNDTAVSETSQNNTATKPEENTQKEETTASNNNNTGRLMTVNATAYAGHTITATGTTPKWGTIAVDPSVIPYGTKVYIPKFDMVFTAEDCGGAIKGNKIDIFMNSEAECNSFGRQNLEIQILG
ncbi:hydrolase [[Clostridium] sordellii]|uniref:SH3 domain-containing protein n=2 Tax=Paraclostridium sordellii TaxID=1505 RepID=UPI0005E62ACE|nr:SH3 domain-containing protein [Paeniclostridium sordellii]MBS6023592.1 SH3 domain-containing protein [Paeniclostridium sordellii]MCR1849094.1 SH3 domain-containing protein [Paeniclostridium sordellii]MDU4412568.1 SH3 domain-containing protein [Paeniclostridium sordellii]MDU6481419.1 SH3 domain-containing protein [Paeniclostridium sordellii]MRZ28725.1 SH3 domain-containing protein [Paeniclostridium sordellii]